MKRFLPFVLIIFSCSYVSGNDTLRYFIKSKPISELNEPYIEANLCRKPFSNKYFIDIDYGQETAIFTLRERRVSDKFGDNIEFPSRMAALNFLVNIGYYIFDHQYTFDSSGDITSQRLLLRHKNTAGHELRRFD
ncbi:MAG: hypothetical protein IPL63_07175 [Saprospiraceae bacterium]|nr:hypothetical protein [Saprospiraceae bacterium]